MRYKIFNDALGESCTNETFVLKILPIISQYVVHSMKTFGYSSDVPNYVFEGVKNYFTTKTDLSTVESQNVIAQRVQCGKVKLVEAKEIGMDLKYHGAGVYEGSRGDVWWLEGDTIYRQDDSYVEGMIDEWMKTYGEGKG